jgi:hypothetical protein
VYLIHSSPDELISLAHTRAREPPLFVAIYCFKKALFLVNAIATRFGARDPSPFPVPQTSHLPVFADNVLPSILIHMGIVDLSTAAPALANLFQVGGGRGSGDAAVAAAATGAANHDPAHTPALLLAAAPEPTAPPARIGTVPVDGPTPTPAQAYVLRAAAIDACERIVARAHAMGSDGASSGQQRAPPWLKDVTLPDLDIWLWAVAKDRADYRALPRFALRNTPFF